MVVFEFNTADNLNLSRERSQATVNLARGTVKVGNRQRRITKEIGYLVGTQLNDVLTGSSRNETILGGDGNDVIRGGSGEDMLLGFDGNDRIVGGGGNDLIAGSDGRDILTGSAGADSFLYTNSSQGRDHITDFNTNAGDKILITASGFKGGLKGGELAASQFVLGNSAGDRNDRFIYNSRTGLLSFDVDGSGSRDAVAIVKLDGAPQLSASDITLV